MKTLKALLLSLFVPGIAAAGVHVQQNQAITVSSLTVGASGIRFNDGTTQTTAGGSGSSLPGVFPATATVSFPFGMGASTATFGSATSTSFSGNYVYIQSSGSAIPLLIDSNGRPSGALQNRFGALTIRNLTGKVHPLLVLVDSATDVQEGAGVLEIYVDKLTRNDPGIWYHDISNGSGGQLRIDATGTNGPNAELVGSSDTAHGLSKMEPFAIPGSGGTVLQTGSSRCWDNSGFNNMVYWEPLSKGGGMFIQAFDSTGCEAGAGYVASSQTVAISWFTLNAHNVGIRGPFNTTASWNFTLPSTPNNGGQLMAQQANGGQRNWEFMTGGVGGNVPRFTSTSAVPTWGSSVCSSASKAAIAASTPGYLGECRVCSDCTTTYVCASSGTAVGQWSTSASRTAACQ